MAIITANATITTNGTGNVASLLDGDKFSGGVTLQAPQSVAAQIIDLAFPAPVAVDLIKIYRSTVGGGDDISLFAANNPDFTSEVGLGSPTVESGFWQWTLDADQQYWRFRNTGTTNLQVHNLRFEKSSVEITSQATITTNGTGNTADLVDGSTSAGGVTINAATINPGQHIILDFGTPVSLAELDAFFDNTSTSHLHLQGDANSYGNGTFRDVTVSYWQYNIILPSILDYADNHTFKIGDAVGYQGNSYICTAESLNHLPTDTNYWALVSAQTWTLTNANATDGVAIDVFQIEAYDVNTLIYYQQAPNAGGRPSVAIAEILRLMRTELPGEIAYANTKNSVSIDCPVNFAEAPEIIDDTFQNTLIVACSVNTEAQAVRFFRDEITLTIYWIRKRIQVREQVDNAWDAAPLIRAILYNVLTKSVNPDGLNVWKEILPQGIRTLPPQWAVYSGIAVPFLVRQGPGQLFWKQ